MTWMQRWSCCEIQGAKWLTNSNFKYDQFKLQICLVEIAYQFIQAICFVFDSCLRIFHGGFSPILLIKTYLTGIGWSAGTATAVTLFLGLPSMILSEYTR
jgi:hypothetical protein